MTHQRRGGGGRYSGSPSSSPSASSDEEDGWEPGAYGLHDVPRKPRRGFGARAAARTSAAGGSSPAGRSALRKPAAAVAASHVTAEPVTPRTPAARVPAHPLAAARMPPPHAMAAARPVSPSAPGFPFVGMQLAPGSSASTGTGPSLFLRAFSGQLRSPLLSVGAGASAGAAAGLAQRQSSASGAPQVLAERQDSARAFGSELSYKVRRLRCLQAGLAASGSPAWAPSPLPRPLALLPACRGTTECQSCRMRLPLLEHPASSFFVCVLMTAPETALQCAGLARAAHCMPFCLA